MSLPLPFTVVSGYLGAGKTTLINQLLSQTRGWRLAILVNDFGGINIDTSLIQTHDGETISLANGCVCCSLVNGFASALAGILERREQFDHLVIEASGVADPGKIAQYGQMYELPVDGVLVVVDAEQISQQAQNVYVGETVLHQLEQADLLILNKTDLISSAELAETRNWLSRQARGVPVIESEWASVPREVLFGLGNLSEASLPLVVAPVDAHGAKFQAWTLQEQQALTRKALEDFARNLHEDIYRAKGFVFLEEDLDRRYIYQQVGSRWSLEPESVWQAGDEKSTTLVLIGKPREHWQPVFCEFS